MDQPEKLPAPRGAINGEAALERYESCYAAFRLKRRGANMLGARGWRRRRTAAGLMAILGITLTGCAGTTRIGTILDDPSEYDGRTVRVEGGVTQTIAVPFVGGTYAVSDGTGTLRVVSDEGGVPREGAAVSVTGIFRALFSLGAESLSVLQERDRDVR
jgi:hypothetical protein